MKHVVVQSGMRESDVKPRKMFSEFRDLSVQEARRLFGAPEDQMGVGCPSCGSAARKPVFLKNDFRFNLCGDCASVFVSPRPKAEKLAEYYRASKAVEYRAKRFIQQTGEARRFYARAHANWLGRLVDEVGNREARGYADLGTNYPFLFDEIRALGLFDSCHSIAPPPPLAQACREHGAEVAEAIPAGMGAVTAFEQLEHVFSPVDYLKNIHAMLAVGGMLFLTTRTISGFDLQTLWDKTPYIYVPEHLNLPSTEGLSVLLERAGFELVELSTPGELDVELTLESAAADPSIRLPHFIRIMLTRRGVDTRAEFQTFLQKNRLSSHVRLAAVKRS